ncbi:MAG: phage holin [Coprobacillus sp.]
MNKINWRVRFSNPTFVIQLLLAVLTPILAYAGLTAQDLTTWNKLGEIIWNALMNPYILSLVVVSIFNTINDPTTTGICDSHHVMNQEEVDNLKPIE